MSRANLEVELSGVSLRNPLVLASGFVDDDPSLLLRAWNAGFGALTTKSLTPKPREGYKPPIIAFTKAGYLNAVGLANPGIESLPHLLSKLPDEARVIVSLAGSTPEDFRYSSEKADKAKVDIIELNLSCPHVKGMGMDIIHDISYSLEVIESVVSTSSKPVFVKLGLTDTYLSLVSRALDKGVSGFTIMNTVRAMAIDIESLKPILSNVFGGLSGPAIHPIAVRMVYEVYSEYNIPIIGVGGVEDWTDVIEFIAAGASGVGVGSYLFLKSIEGIDALLEGVEKFMVERGFNSISEIRGIAIKR